MARFLSTIPNNTGLYNLGNVWAYPTGGTGPTAYGPTSYFGSDPLPADLGDSLYNPIDLGDFGSPFRIVDISNTHGGLTRKVSTFFKLSLSKSRTIQFTQNYSQFSYHKNTNRNTLIAFYRIDKDKRRVELPINDSGYVYNNSSIAYDQDSPDENESTNADYPINRMDPGDYMFLITNDIRFLETNYSISISVANLDWRFVTEEIDDSLDFGLVINPVEGVPVDFGTLAPWSKFASIAVDCLSPWKSLLFLI